MIKALRIAPLLIVSVFYFASATASPRFGLEFETGPVWSSRNEARVPGNTGTGFDLADFDTGAYFYYRITPRIVLGERHEIRGLYAPFDVSISETPTTAIDFQNQTFPAGQRTNYGYRFNSYRLSYIYHFQSTGPWHFRLGFTNKIRDADIILENSATRSAKSNIGYVPLLHFGVRYDLNEEFYVDLDIDALAAPQGRAEDVALRLGYRLPKGFKVLAGYRMLEGGADNDEVFTFAWFHYLSLALRYDFDT